MKKEKLTSHVTPFGHHSYRAFRECPRRYYYSYLYNGGMESKIGNVKTTEGTVFHAFTHAWHRTNKAKGALAEAQKEFLLEQKRWDIFKNPEKVEEAQETIARCCTAYIQHDQEWQAQHGKLTFLEFEQFMQIDLGNGTPFTSRRDAIVKWRGGIYVFETKLSGLSEDRMKDMHRSGGQVSGYVKTEQAHHPDCNGALINHMRSLKTPTLHRTPILRTPEQLARWAKRVTKTYREMEEAKANNYYMDDEDACVTYTTTCPYRDACACDTEEERQRVLDTFYRKRT